MHNHIYIEQVYSAAKNIIKLYINTSFNYTSILRDFTTYSLLEKYAFCREYLHIRHIMNDKQHRPAFLASSFALSRHSF